MGIASYETDIVAWANEQARLLRAGRFDLLDREHLAEEIEDVGKSEQRELSNRMALLLTHLLKWQFQPERQGSSWKRTIREQRRGIEARLDETPSLRAKLDELKWWESVWSDAVAQATQETGIDALPEHCPWTTSEILEQEWLPG